MSNINLPYIGFDRFVDLSWADYSLDLAITNNEPEMLKNWISTLIDGEESARKTFNLLNNLWLRSFPETEHIRTEALTLALKVPQHYRIVLHWGMAVANFELFQKATASMGKLLRLQGSFKRKEIEQRLAEMYSNQGTIPRAVSRIIQSVCKWELIKETKKYTYVSDKKITVRDADLLSWLLQAALNRQKNRLVSISDLFRLPELFPFDIVENGLKTIRESSVFTIIREGLNQEYIVLG